MRNYYLTGESKNLLFFYYRQFLQKYGPVICLSQGLLLSLDQLFEVGKSLQQTENRTVAFSLP